jgi:uncharacterized protein (TIGR00266 family)
VEKQMALQTFFQDRPVFLLCYSSMAFCTQCGSQSAPEARFCKNCGSPIGSAGGAAAAGPPLPPPVEPLDFSIEGANLQVARIKIKPGQEIYADAGRMVYKTANVQWDTRMTGETLGDKLMGAFRRTITGESLFVTYFRTDSPGEVGLAGHYPGKIEVFKLAPGRSVLAQRDAFLLAESSVQYSVALVKKLGAGFFGGEGFILEKFTGPGTVFIHAGGDFVNFDLVAGQELQVDAGCLVAFDETVDYDIQFVGGIKTALFGGEGIFLASLRGPGRVVVQSMTLERMRKELAPGRTRDGDAHNALDTLGGILGSQ